MATNIFQPTVVNNKYEVYPLLGLINPSRSTCHWVGSLPSQYRSGCHSRHLSFQSDRLLHCWKRSRKWLQLWIRTYSGWLSHLTLNGVASMKPWDQIQIWFINMLLPLWRELIKATTQSTTWRAEHSYLGYSGAVSECVGNVMCSYSAVNLIPMVSNWFLLNGILKEGLLDGHPFNGFVISDYGELGKIAYGKWPTTPTQWNSMMQLPWWSTRESTWLCSHPKLTPSL